MIKNILLISAPIPVLCHLSGKLYGSETAFVAVLAGLVWGVAAFLFFKSEVDDQSASLGKMLDEIKGDLSAYRALNDDLKVDIARREEDLNEEKKKFSRLLDKTCEAGLFFDESAICTNVGGAEVCMFGTLTLLYRRCFKHAETKSGRGTANEIAMVAKNVLIRLSSRIQDSSSVVNKFEAGKVVRRLDPSLANVDDLKEELREAVRALSKVMLPEHSLNVALATQRICIEKNLNYTTQLIACLAASLHDIGKAEGQGNVHYDTRKHHIASRELAAAMMVESLHDLGIGHTPRWLDDVLDIIERHHTAEERPGNSVVDRVAAIVRQADIAARETELYRARNEAKDKPKKRSTREEVFGEDDPLKPMKMPPVAQLDPASRDPKVLKEILTRFVAPTNRYFPVNGEQRYRYKAFENHGRIWIRQDHCEAMVKELFNEKDWPPTVNRKIGYPWQGTLIAILQAFDKTPEFKKIVCRDMLPEDYYGLPVRIMRKKHVEGDRQAEKPRKAIYIPFHANKIKELLGFDDDHFERIKNESACDTGETYLHEIRRVDVCWNKDEPSA